MDGPNFRIHLTEVTKRLSLFSGSVNNMVMLVPFTTALPPQNDYSEYAPRNPDTKHECRTDETERLTAENQKESTPESDEEHDEEDFSKVLGMLMNAGVTPEKSQPTLKEASKSTATTDASPSDLKATTASTALKNVFSTESKTAAAAQSSAQSAIPEKMPNLDLAKSMVSDAGSASTQTGKPEMLNTTKVSVPEIPDVRENAEVQPVEISDAPIVPLSTATTESFDSPSSNLISANLQANEEVLPGKQVELQQLSIETTFVSGPRPYESTKDTDAVTQEIMNALSRAVAASAPTKSPSEISGPQPGVGSAGLLANTKPAPFGADRIGPVNSPGSLLNNSSDEVLQQTGPRQIIEPGNSQSGITDQLWMQQPGSDADRGSGQTSSGESDQTMGRLASASSSGADGTKHSPSGTIAFTLPDLTTSVTSEMRQPLSSQVSRAVMEYLERRTTAESDTITVQLDPPDLGEMVIELSKSKEGLSVRVTAREAVTMDMLLARGSEIETQLRGEKMDLRSLEFLSPDMMNGGAFQGQTPQDSTSRFDQPAGTQRRSSRNISATQISTGTTSRPGDSQHALTFRA